MKVNRIKPQISRNGNGKTLIVTVDIGKVMNTGYYRYPDGEDIKPFEFFNNGRGFAQFWDRICRGMKEGGDKVEEIVIGFESTGPYAEPLVHYLQKRKVRLVQVNPMHTKRLKELQGNSPNKTDQKDPRVIADIMELGHALSLVIPKDCAAELRRLTQARERAMQRLTALFNQLQHLVFVIFPEFLRIFKDIRGKSAQYLLKNLTTPQSIVEYGPEALCIVLKRISRGRFGNKQAQALYEEAHKSVGIQEGQESIVTEISHTLALIEVLEQFIADVQEKMSTYLKQIPYSRVILSIKGIGDITAAGLIGEVGDFRQFKTIGEVLKLAGLNLFEISSGKHKGNRHISKRGRPLMRKLLFFAAINVVRKGGILHKTYQNYLSRGMEKMKALIAIARKLLGIIFALVRDQREYIEGYNEIKTVVEKVA